MNFRSRKYYTSHHHQQDPRNISSNSLRSTLFCEGPVEYIVFIEKFDFGDTTDFHREFQLRTQDSTMNRRIFVSRCVKVGGEQTTINKYKMAVARVGFDP